MAAKNRQSSRGSAWCGAREMLEFGVEMVGGRRRSRTKASSRKVTFRCTGSRRMWMPGTFGGRYCIVHSETREDGGWLVGCGDWNKERTMLNARFGGYGAYRTTQRSYDAMTRTKHAGGQLTHDTTTRISTHTANTTTYHPDAALISAKHMPSRPIAGTTTPCRHETQWGDASDHGEWP